VQYAPLVPERVVVSVLVEESRDFVHAVDRRHPLKKMADDVKRGVAEMVERQKCGERDLVDLVDGATLPERFEPLRIETLENFIRETEMNFELNGKFRIEQIAAPFPIRFLRERRNVVAELILGVGACLITDRVQSCDGPLDFGGLAENVDVRLHAETWMRDEIRAKREALRDQVRDAGFFESLRNREVVAFDPFKSLGRRGDVAFHPRQHPIGQKFRASLAERNHQPRKLRPRE
jgi:hypothetical protein